MKTTTTDTLAPLAIVGLGNQAQSWYLNLRDSQLKTSLAVRQLSDKVQKFQTKYPEATINLLNPQWLKQQRCIALLIPDDQHLQFLQDHATHITPGTWLIYAHGFSEFSHQLTQQFPQFLHLLLAPKSIATELRQNYLEKKPLAGVFCVPEHYVEKEELTHAIKFYARALGITWGPFPVTFEQECKADLFSEQVLLCNLIPNLTGKAYQKLLQKNIPWQLAFCEIFLELKLIVNAFEAAGPEKFFELISPNALMGSDYYHQEWSKLIPWDKFFERCWENLDNQQMVDYLKKTDVQKIRNSILSFWQKHELTEGFKRYQRDLGKQDEKN